MLAAAAAWPPLAAQAQNVAVVNGKPVPKARVDTIVAQVQKQAAAARPAGSARPREAGARQGRDRRDPEPGGRAPRPQRRRPTTSRRWSSRAQGILIGLLSQDLDKTTKVSDADVQTEYDKFKAQASGTEYKARHILVEKEDEAKAIIAQLKAGAKFEDLAKKNSKDPGSAPNGGDLDFASAERPTCPSSRRR